MTCPMCSFQIEKHSFMQLKQCVNEKRTGENVIKAKKERNLEIEQYKAELKAYKRE